MIPLCVCIVFTQARVPFGAYTAPGRGSAETRPIPPCKQPLQVRTRELTASVYSASLAGSRMANGDPYRPYWPTAASNDYDLGTVVTVERDGVVVPVIITDRMNKRFSGKRIDLSAFAWGEVSRHGRPGLRRVRVQVIGGDN